MATLHKPILHNSIAAIVIVTFPRDLNVFRLDSVNRPFVLGVYIRILLYGGHHYEWQKCIAVIERKVLIVSFFGIASDYSNKTCIYRSMCLYLTKYTSLVGVVTYIREKRYDYHLSLNHCNTFLPLKMAATIQKYMDVYDCDVTMQKVLCILLQISWQSYG